MKLFWYNLLQDRIANPKTDSNSLYAMKIVSTFCAMNYTLIRWLVHLADGFVCNITMIVGASSHPPLACEQLL